MGHGVVPARAAHRDIAARVHQRRPIGGQPGHRGSAAQPLATPPKSNRTPSASLRLRVWLLWVTDCARSGAGHGARHSGSAAGATSRRMATASKLRS